MNRHLSLQQIAKYLSGDSASVDLRHSEECEMCRGDLVRFESSLVLFRTCVHEWSVEMTAKPFARLDSWGLYQPQKKSWILSLAFQSLAVAILFAMASSPTVRQAARQAIEVYAPDLAASFERYFSARCRAPFGPSNWERASWRSAMLDSDARPAHRRVLAAGRRPPG